MKISTQAAGSITVSGFTLIEMMVVVTIIAILALIAMPSSTGKINRAYINENLQLVAPFTERIGVYYATTGTFPADNDSAGLPAPHLVTGNYLSRAEVVNGAIHLTLGQKIGANLQGKIVSLRPIFVPGSPGSPISWVCGYDAVPENMSAPEPNLTDVERTDLPLKCL